MIVSSVVASPKGSVRARYNKLHSEYLTTRNRDAHAENSEVWRKLAITYQGFRKQGGKDQTLALAAYDEAVLWEGLYRRWKKQEDLDVCKEALYFILDQHSEHSLADDALLRLGDIAFQIEESPIDAEQFYEEILSRYPKSDMALVASERLATIASEAKSKSSRKKTTSLTALHPSDGKKVIVIDPGHGGEDFGAVGKKGLLEKDVVLAIAVELEKLLEQELNVEVHLTRRKDVFIPLEKRTAFANKMKAALFVSLHVNASEYSKLNGLEVYYLDNTGDRGSLKLAERENAHSPYGGVGSDLQFILSDLIQAAKFDDSVVLGQVLYGTMLSSLRTRWKGVKGLGVKKAPFYVLVGAHMPCVLVEMFFIDHKVDGPRLASPDFRSDLTHSLYAGIKKYLEQVG